MKQEISFKSNKEAIVITIPKSLIEFACENHPECPLIIHDLDAFCAQLIFELENNLGGTDESGLTGLQKLLDKGCMEVVEGGFDFVGIKNQNKS